MITRYSVTFSENTYADNNTLTWAHLLAGSTWHRKSSEISHVLCHLSNLVPGVTHLFRFCFKVSPPGVSSLFLFPKGFHVSACMIDGGFLRV